MGNDEITQKFIDIGKSCPSNEVLMSKICFFMAILENKILVKISEFTVFLDS